MSKVNGAYGCCKSNRPASGVILAKEIKMAKWRVDTLEGEKVEALVKAAGPGAVAQKEKYRELLLDAKEDCETVGKSKSGRWHSRIVDMPNRKLLVASLR